MQEENSQASAPASGHGHGRKARTKTFSGCWTCRAKHVKCDESRPTCKRCQRSGLPCEGYGVRLSWTSVRGPSNFRGGGPKKAAARLAHAAAAASAASGPAGDDQAGEARRGHGGSAELSPGSTPHDTTGSSGISPNSAVEEEDSAEGGELGSRIFHSYKAAQCPVRVQPRLEHADGRSSVHGSNDSPCGIVTSCEPPTPITSNEMASNEMDASYQDITWLPPRRSNSPPTNQDGQQQQQVDMANAEVPLRHLDALPNLGLQCQLMEHWTLHLCDALNPVPGIHNPLRTIMMPIALEGARADLKSSTGATALFHLISSASAFHLSQKRTSPEEKRTLESVALEHHNLGITHLGQNIQSDDLSQCVPVLASLVMCILNEAISTPAPYWRLHFRGAVEWVNHINPQVWHQTESASVIYQMFSGMATLVQSQLLLDGHESSRWDLPYNPASQPGPYILDMAFGLPQPIMQCLNSIKSIQKRSDRDSSAESTAQSLDRIELELYLSSPKKPDAAYGKEYGDLVYHHGYTYYFAALVYMKRTIKDAPIEEVQALIEQSLHHIEILQMCTDRPFSPMLWPIAMIAFEISHAMPQNRMLKCLDGFAERSGLMLWTHLGRMLRDLWALRRTEGNANLKWHKSVLTSVNDSFMLL